MISRLQTLRACKVTCIILEMNHVYMYFLAFVGSQHRPTFLRVDTFSLNSSSVSKPVLRSCVIVSRPFFLTIHHYRVRTKVCWLESLYHGFYRHHTWRHGTPQTYLSCCFVHRVHWRFLFDIGLFHKLFRLRSRADATRQLSSNSPVVERSRLFPRNQQNSLPSSIVPCSFDCVSLFLSVVRF